MDIWDVVLSIWMVFMVLVIARVIYVFVRHRRSFKRGLFGGSGSSEGSNEGDFGDSGGGSD